jgi:hypothetical protein
MSVRLPTKDHLKAAIVVGLLAGILYLIGDAVSEKYGLWGGFFVMAFLSALLYLSAAINYEK